MKKSWLALRSDTAVVCLCLDSVCQFMFLFHIPQVFASQALEHVLNQSREIVVVAHAPVTAGVCAVKLVWPCISNALKERIDVIMHLEMGEVLSNLGEDLMGSEIHRPDVVCPLLQHLIRCFHKLHGVVDAVIDVHHWQSAVALKSANEIVSLKSMVENLNSVIGGTATWSRVSRDNSRVSEATKVQASFVIVILSHEFHVYLRYAIDSPGSLDAYVRCWVFGRILAERSDRAWDKKSHSKLIRQIESIVEAINIDTDGKWDVLLSNSTQQRTEMN